MQSENAKLKMRPQNKSAKKMPLKKTNKQNWKKNANCMFFAFFGGGFVRASDFSKIAKNLGKMQKTNSGNVHVLQKQISRSCMFFAFLIAFFLRFPGPRFLGLHFLGAFFCMFFAL